MSDKKTAATDHQIEGLFDKFTSSIMVHCKTDSQKNNTMAIARMLWLVLVAGADSEENVYIAVRNISQNDETATVFTSLYFQQMKSNLTTEEINMLQTHYEDEDNFNSLQSWGEMYFLNERH